MGNQMSSYIVAVFQENAQYSGCIYGLNVAIPDTESMETFRIAAHSTMSDIIKSNPDNDTDYEKKDWKTFRESPFFRSDAEYYEAGFEQSNSGNFYFKKLER